MGDRESPTEEVVGKGRMGEETQRTSGGSLVL